MQSYRIFNLLQLALELLVSLLVSLLQYLYFSIFTFIKYEVKDALKHCTTAPSEYFSTMEGYSGGLTNALVCLQVLLYDRETFEEGLIDVLQLSLCILLYDGETINKGITEASQQWYYIKCIKTFIARKLFNREADTLIYITLFLNRYTLHIIFQSVHKLTWK